METVDRRVRRAVSWPLLLCLVFFTCGCSGSGEVRESARRDTGWSGAFRTTKPSVPVDAKLELVGDVSADGLARFRLSVTPDIDCSDARIDITFPGKTEVVEGVTSWQGALSAGKVMEMEVSAVVPDVRYRVTADIILVQSKSMKFRKRVVLKIGPADGEVYAADKNESAHRHRAVPLKKGR